MKFFKHLHTINHHRRLVRKYCFKLGLYKQGILHDLSKYSPVEFWAGVKYYQGTKSPNVAARLAIGYSAAWMHHKGRNKHHIDYWTDYGTEMDGEFGLGLVGVEMPVRYVAEMLCDRLAACKTYNKEKYTDSDPINYFNRSCAHYMIHKNTAELLRRLLQMIADEGEEATFKYIRMNLLGKKK